MGANCTSCERCIKGRVGDPVKELSTFKQFYKDVMLADARKKGKNGITGAFEELGGGNDGQVTREEMVKYLTRHSYPGDANALFDLVDIDNEGLISKTEFGRMTEVDFIKKGPVRAFKNFLSKKFGRTEDAFKVLDESHDKNLDANEFVTNVEKMGYDGDATIIFQILDDNKDGKVTLADLQKVLGKLKAPPEEGEQFDTQMSHASDKKKKKKKEKS